MTNYSKLDAVNTMLFAIGESPVDTLDGPRSADVSSALKVLATVSLKVQTEGWSFNTDTEFPLTRTANAPFEIKVPGNCISCDPTDKSRDIVVRGGRLYDKDNHTSSFPDDISIPCNITWLLEFDDLPTTARTYIAVRATREFQTGIVGSDTLNSFTQVEEFDARRVFRRNNTRTRDKNILKASPSVQRILSR